MIFIHLFLNVYHLLTSLTLFIFLFVINFEKPVDENHTDAHPI